MSEYWKSTPKYWCKFCKTYVRDTKFDKQQHDATPRHQGSIQRSLRTLHRDHERQERESQRAKDEVARLNGIVSGKPTATPSVSKSSAKNSAAPATAQQSAQASLEERKKQVAQLAEMGVAIPQEYRSEMALAGDWESVAGPSQAEDDVKPQVKNFGVRKRKHETGDDGEGDEETGQGYKRKGWGSEVKTYPGSRTGVDDIEALLMGSSGNTGTRRATPRQGTLVKQEQIDEDQVDSVNEKATGTSAVETVKQEQEDSQNVPVVFKKRKAKPLKNG